MGRCYLVKRTTSLANSEIKGNVRERLKGCSVKELDEQSVSPYGRGYKCTLLSSFSLQCDSQKLTENMGKVRTLRKSTVSYAQACTFCSLSVSLYLSYSLPHTHNSVQPKHPWGRVSGCWKCQTALSRPISVRGSNHCVWRVGMSVCSAKEKKHPTPRLKAPLV